MLIHVITQKGKGYAPAEAAADKYHGVSKFDVISGAQASAPSNGAPRATPRCLPRPWSKEAREDEYDRRHQRLPCPAGYRSRSFRRSLSRTKPSMSASPNSTR